MELESCVPTEKWATLPLMTPQLWWIGKQPVTPCPPPPAMAHLLFFCSWILDDAGTTLARSSWSRSAPRPQLTPTAGRSLVLHGL